MHISDGVLSTSAVIGGYAVTGGITWLSLRMIKKQYDNPQNAIPRVALLTAVYFVASLIHIPMPPTTVHFIFGGLMGIMLGWFSFPAILVGTLLQTVLFQHGGLTTLGVNTFLVGIPALLAFALFQLRSVFGREKPLPNGVLSFTASFMAVTLLALMTALLLIYAIPASLDVTIERQLIITFALAHLPVALIEGAFTVLIVLYLLRVKPALLDSEHL